ncbi:MAG: FtsL-like putative cell division protein [Bacteroidales bacterium]
MREKEKRSKVGLKQILGGGVLSNKFVTSLIPYLVYVFLWTVVYVINGHWGQSVLLERSVLSRDIQKLQVEATAIKVELERVSLSVDMLKNIEDSGLGLVSPDVPNYEIKVRRRSE